MEETQTAHDLKVSVLQAQTLEFYSKRQKIKFFHGNTNSTRPQKIPDLKRLDVSHFNKVLEVNAQARYIVVEPNVPMDALLQKTLPYGLRPPIVTEFPGITVGGAVIGGAGESSSFKYGCVHETCIEYEIVLGNGQKMTLSEQQNKDLFHALPCSCGSLGIVTAIKMRLIPALPYVSLTYHRVESITQATSLIASKAKSDVDYLDGIMFSKNSGVVMSGKLCERLDLPIATFHKATDEWFSIHTKQVTKIRDEYRELIPITDYLFRYDRGAFWAGRFAFNVYHVRFNRLFRTVFASLLKTRTLYSYLQGSNLSQRFLVQDLCMPSRHVAEFVRFVDDHYSIYPLWLCPLKPTTSDFLSPTYNKSDLVINVGVYGELNTAFDDFVTQNRDLQEKVAELGGRKVLYAHSYYEEEEFWKIYNQKTYLTLRKKYHADITFPDLYQKTAVKHEMKPTLIGGWLELFKERLLSQF